MCIAYLMVFEEVSELCLADEFLGFGLWERGHLVENEASISTAVPVEGHRAAVNDEVRELLRDAKHSLHFFLLSVANARFLSCVFDARQPLESSLA